MTRFHNYSPEKPDKSKADIYFKSILLGILGAIVLIFTGLTIKFIIKNIIEYWIWVIIIAAGIFLLKKFFFKSKNKGKKRQQLPLEEYYE